MVTQISGLSADTAGFILTGNIVKEDYDNVIMPAVKQITASHHSLNLLLVINTDLSNFTAGAWMKDAMLGIKNLTKFKRVALVSNSHVVQQITAVAATFVPGEYRFFTMPAEAEAKAWVSGNLATS